MVSSIYPSSNTVSLSRRWLEGETSRRRRSIQFSRETSPFDEGDEGKKEISSSPPAWEWDVRRWNDGNGTKMEANGPLDRPLIG